MDIITLLGAITLLFVTSIVILFLISIVFIILLFKRDWLILPRITLFTIDAFYGFLKKIVPRFGIDDSIVDSIGIEIRNRVSFESFKNVDPKNRVLFLPQCLRHIDCPAKLTPTGIECQGCGRCIVPNIKKEAEAHGYKVFVVPGSTFVWRILKQYRPSATLGVACHEELNMAMMKASQKGFAVQGVMLSKDGCVRTEVDREELFKRIKCGIEEFFEKSTKKCSSDSIAPEDI
ncbi:MAG: DUF116 domain-containing protein [Candidatus Hydrothermarchaeota archaeon]